MRDVRPLFNDFCTNDVIIDYELGTFLSYRSPRIPECTIYNNLPTVKYTMTECLVYSHFQRKNFTGTLNSSVT